MHSLCCVYVRVYMYVYILYASVHVNDCEFVLCALYVLGGYVCAYNATKQSSTDNVIDICVKREARMNVMTFQQYE